MTIRLHRATAAVALADHHLQPDAEMSEIREEEVQGAVIELDPLHLQMPHAHHLPEDLRGGEALQRPLLAAHLQ